MAVKIYAFDQPVISVSSVMEICTYCTFSKMMTQNNEDEPNIITESHNYSRDKLGPLAKQNQNKQYLVYILNINI